MEGDIIMVVVKYSCKHCKKKLEETEIPCPYCGKSGREILLEENINIEMYESSLHKKKVPKKFKKKKHVAIEIFKGAEKSEKLNRFMQKIRIIDRENNSYFEKVVDPKTNEVIRYSDEPLNHHFGHGSAKNKK